MKTLTIAVVLSFFWVGCSPAADFEVGDNKEYCGGNFIRMRGVITKGDAETFRQLVEGTNARIKRFGECYNFADQPYVILGSEGGDIEEAVAIGSMIRKNNFRTSVHVAGCYSSCVLIFAAGVERSTWSGKVGIHRPYLQAVDKKLSVSEINALRQKQSDTLKRYAHWLDISPQLIDDMNAIPPEEIRILSEASMRNYRIYGEDPSFQEFRIGRQAQLYNVSSAEYRSRHMAAIKLCEQGPSSDYRACSESAMLRISLKEAKARWEQFQQCKSDRVSSVDIDECFRKHVTRVSAK